MRLYFLYYIYFKSKINYYEKINILTNSINWI